MAAGPWRGRCGGYGGVVIREYGSFLRNDYLTSCRRVADIELNLLNAFQYTMPAYSVTTLVLISDGLPGDFNRDQIVDAADFTVWRDSVGQTGTELAADGDENNTVDAADYELWVSNFGRSEAGGAGSLATVPEPTSSMLIFLTACGLAMLPAHGNRG